MASGSKKVVRRIKASTSESSSSTKPVTKPEVTRVVKAETPTTETKPTSKAAVKSVNETKAADKTVKQSTTKRSTRKSGDRKPFILFRPFVAFGRYVRDSWRELRRVEWPSRRATWKMTLAVIIFCVIVGLFVLLCDWASQWLIEEVVL